MTHFIEGNAITQTIQTGHGYSPIAGQGFGQGTNRNLVIRGNTIDQGPSGVAWFGIEVWDNVGLIIENNSLKGASALASIPRSDGAIVRNNRFDMTQAYWGIELSDVSDAQVYGNTVWGNSGSVRPGWPGLRPDAPGLRDGRAERRPQQHHQPLLGAGERGRLRPHDHRQLHGGRHQALRLHVQRSGDARPQRRRCSLRPEHVPTALPRGRVR